MKTKKGGIKHSLSRYFHHSARKQGSEHNPQTRNEQNGTKAAGPRSKRRIQKINCIIGDSHDKVKRC
jgi:hypothetical protein